MKTHLLIFSLVATFAFLNKSLADQNCRSLVNGETNRIASALEAAQDSVQVMHTKLNLGMVLFLNKAEGSLIYISKGGTSVPNVSLDDIYLTLPKAVSCKEDLQEGINFQFEGATFSTVGQFADGSVMAEHQSGFFFLKRISLKDFELGVQALSKEIHAGDKVLIEEDRSRIEANVISIEGIYAKVTYEKQSSGFSPDEIVTKLVPLSSILDILESKVRNPGLL